MEFVMIPNADGTARRLPIPPEIVNATDDRAAVLAYVAAPPAEALAAAEVIGIPAPDLFAAPDAEEL